MTELRKTGIDVLGDIPWGSHFCNFYEAKQDLLDTLVPYFKAGLESNEFCLWVISNSGLITVEEAKRALEQAVPDLDRHFSDGDIEILHGLDRYLEENVFNLERVTREWDTKLKRALALGYDGIRVSGDTFWLEENGWKDFYAYEKQLNDFITGLPMTVMCTYPQAKTEAFDILNVVHAHQFAIARRQGEWEVLETSELIRSKAEIKKLNEELEQRVDERTRQLATAIEKLKYEIAERKKAEQDLKTSEETKKLIMNSALDAIVCMEASGRIIMWTPQAEKIFGWKEDEIIGEKIADTIIPVQYREKHRKGLEEYLKTGEGPVLNKLLETTALNRHSKEFPVELTIIPVIQGETKFFCAFIRDITERKKAEKTLIESENYLRTIIQTEPQCVKLLGINGELENMNPAGLEMIEADSLQQVKGKSVLNLINKPYRKAFKNLTQNVFTGNSGTLEFEITGLKGTHRWLETHVVPLKDAEGKILSMLGISMDITERKKAEEELHQINEELRSLSSHLQNVREEERMQIARDIHDDLGQQLSGLKMDVIWLNKKLETEDEIVKQKMNSMIELIDETLKSVKRISSDLRPSILDDFGLIAALEWHSGEVAKRSEIKVDFSTNMSEPDIPVAMATGIFRIYQELVTNSVRHANAHVITSSLQLKNNHLILKVKDDGQGMDPAINGTKKTLGLIGIKERTFVLGGKYDLKSEPGKGTVVEISIPL